MPQCSCLAFRTVRGPKTGQIPTESGKNVRQPIPHLLQTVDGRSAQPDGATIGRNYTAQLNGARTRLWQGLHYRNE
jgi:hypothetical protein